MPITYEEWRQQGDAPFVGASPGTNPQGWTPDSPHGGTVVDGVYVPPAPVTSTPVPAPVETPSSSTTNDFSTYQKQATDLLGGEFSSSITPESIRSAQEKEQEALRAQASSIYDPLINRARETGAKQVGTAAGASGQRAGFNLSTAEADYVRGVEKQVDDRIKEINDAKIAYIATGDTAAIERANAALDQLQQRKDQFVLNRATLALQLMGENRQNQALDLQTISALREIPAGETVTVNGRTYTGIGVSEVDPFFSGSDIVNLMKSLPSGQVKIITDPNTGNEYIIEGLQTEDPNIKTIQSTDASGNVTITSYRLTANGGAEILNTVSAGKIGKPMQGPTTIVLNQQNAGMLGDAAAALNATIGEDGFFNTANYIKERDKYVTQTGQDPRLFDNTFRNRLNPNDPSARRFLSSSEVELGTNVWTSEVEQSFINMGLSQDIIDQAKAAGLSPSELMQ